MKQIEVMKTDTLTYEKEGEAIQHIDAMEREGWAVRQIVFDPITYLMWVVYEENR